MFIHINYVRMGNLTDLTICVNNFALSTGLAAHDSLTEEGRTKIERNPESLVDSS